MLFMTRKHDAVEARPSKCHLYCHPSRCLRSSPSTSSKETVPVAGAEAIPVIRRVFSAFVIWRASSRLEGGCQIATRPRLRFSSLQISANASSAGPALIACSNPGGSFWMFAGVAGAPGLCFSSSSCACLDASPPIRSVRRCIRTYVFRSPFAKSRLSGSGLPMLTTVVNFREFRDHGLIGGLHEPRWNLAPDRPMAAETLISFSEAGNYRFKVLSGDRGAAGRGA